MSRKGSLAEDVTSVFDIVVLLAVVGTGETQTRLGGKTGAVSGHSLNTEIDLSHQFLRHMEFGIGLCFQAMKLPSKLMTWSVFIR